MPDSTSTSSTTDTPNDPRVERTRQAVVDAGMSVLIDEGPDAITHAAIASAAGLSRTTLYKYWPTRAKLLLEVLAAFDAHPEMASSGDLRADLLHFLRELQMSMSDPTRRRIFSSLLAQAQWDEDLMEAKNSLRAVPLGGLESLFSAAVERGELVHGVIPIQAAGRLLGPLMFAALIAGQDVTEIELEPIVDDWLATVRP